MTPTMHEDYPVGTRVAFSLDGGPDEFTGIIDGICFQHVFFTYMVTLDAPLPGSKYEMYANWKVVPVPGTLIRKKLS